MAPTFFRSPAEFRAWLAKHHQKERELLVGFHKKHSDEPSMTWPESVDEALCFGWIDGVRKRIDDDRYTIRFTPRKQVSTWSAINIKRATELSALERMKPAGLAAFAARKDNRSRIYAYEQRADSLPEPFAAIMRKNKAAWTFFSAQPPSYRKTLSWWVASAKKEETRIMRLDKLIEASANKRRL